MQSALDRRRAFIELMYERRHKKIDNLAFEFGVDRRTIQDYYNQKELKKLLLSVQDTQIEFSVYMAVLYGFLNSVTRHSARRFDFLEKKKRLFLL